MFETSFAVLAADENSARCSIRIGDRDYYIEIDDDCEEIVCLAQKSAPGKNKWLYQYHTATSPETAAYWAKEFNETRKKILEG